MPEIPFLRLSLKSVSRKRSMFAWPAGSFRISHLCYGRFAEGAQAGLREGCKPVWAKGMSQLVVCAFRAYACI